MLREAYPMLRHFHDLILSYEVKAMKPRREIFQAAIARAGCRAEECFYTDDIAAFVDAAKSLGIDAVQFESVPQLEGRYGRGESSGNKNAGRFWRTPGELKPVIRSEDSDCRDGGAFRPAGHRVPGRRLPNR